MKLLLTNDDGITAKGLITLAKRLSQEHEVVVCAPKEERSGASHSMNFHRPFPVKAWAEDGIRYFEVDGSPCDAVHLGVLELLKDEPKPDVLISGINNFMNLGTDCLYSGTVNAAIDGGIVGIKSIAVSLETGKDDFYDDTADFVATHLQELVSLLPDYKTTFNINVPTPRKENWKGVHFTTTGERAFEDAYQYIDGKGYLITGHPVMLPNKEHSDIIKTHQGYISIAPIKVDFNDYELWNKLKNHKLK